MASDEKIAEASALVGHEELTWGRVYDIIEFLGGAKGVAKAGFASVTKTGRMKRTANHYRHLGDPTQYKLPPDPPTLPDAVLFATRLLKLWIDERL